MVSKLVGPGAKSAAGLSAEVGIHHGTLSRWLREEGSVRPTLAKKMTPEPLEQPAVERRRRKERSPEEKLRLLLASQSVPAEELGAFLRREGLHDAELQEWQASAREGLEGRSDATARKKQQAKRVRALEKELTRKDRALAEAAALLMLKKKVQAIWGDEDDDTNHGSER